MEIERLRLIIRYNQIPRISMRTKEFDAFAHGSNV